MARSLLSELEGQFEPWSLGVEHLVIRRRPTLKARSAAIERNETLHFTGAGIKVVLEHLDCILNFGVCTAVSGKLLRPGDDPDTVKVVFDLELTKNAGHVRLQLRPEPRSLRIMRFRESSFYPFSNHLRANCERFKGRHRERCMRVGTRIFDREAQAFR